MSEKELNKFGEGVGFERIRRITGYLVGTVDRFNNAKRAACERNKDEQRIEDRSDHIGGGAAFRRNHSGYLKMA